MPAARVSLSWCALQNRVLARIIIMVELLEWSATSVLRRVFDGENFAVMNEDDVQLRPGCNQH
jgi:hypothetical protein